VHSSHAAPQPGRPQLVDLRTVLPADLEPLWAHETCWWRQHLHWDVSASLAALRRVVGRHGLSGHAVRVDTHTVGYAYYLVSGNLGVLSSLVLAPAWQSDAAVGPCLLQATLATLRRHDVQRVESPCVSPAYPWLVPVYEQAGFCAARRAFLRMTLAHAPVPSAPPSGIQLAPWQDTHMPQAATIMQAAYQEMVDTTLNVLYRTVEGCSGVLENLLQQGGCGPLLPEASAVARYRDQIIGFVIATTIAPHQGHLAQVAVLPAYQGQGVGRLLVSYCAHQLARHDFESLSLIVSQANTRACRLYEAMGLHKILTFPVFVWEQVPG